MAGGENRELGELLGSLLSSPEIMGKLISVLGAADKGGGEAEEKGPAEQEQAVSATESGEAKDGEAAVSAPPKRSASRREGLLRALRPYLSERRCKRLDNLIRISPMLNYLHGEQNV